MITRFIAILLTGTSYCIGQPNSPVPYAPELFSDKVSGAVCGFSPDGTIIYFAREDSIAGQIHLFSATRRASGWSNAQLLPFSGRYNDLGGRLTKDGGTFYFTSDRPGGSSNPDDAWNIWITTRSTKGWAPPRPLAAVNNKGLECCPLPLPNGGVIFSADREPTKSWWLSVWDPSAQSETLLDPLNHVAAWQWPSSLNQRADIMFINSMKRPDTHGMDDIYVSFFVGDAWSPPLNLGPDINSKAYEDGAILSHDEEWLIFCRHTTASTPSRVVCVKWKPILERLQPITPTSR